jgi:SAM-dependent methyltransferase
VAHVPEYFDREYFTLHAGKARYLAALIEVLRSHGVESGRVLDVGCGFGFFVEALEDRGYEPSGLEVSDYACERARERTQAPIVAGSAERPFPFGAGSFDAVTMFDVIEHLGGYETALAECRRVLRPGGCLFVITLSGHSIARPLLGKHWSWHKDDTHVHMFTPTSLKRALDDAGFADTALTTFFNLCSVGESTPALKPLQRIGRFVRVPWIGDSILAVAKVQPVSSRDELGDDRSDGPSHAPQEARSA